METVTFDRTSKMTSKVVYDPKPRAYKAVRVWLSNGRRMLGIWTGTKWWSVEGEIEPVKWELEERRKRPTNFAKPFLEINLRGPFHLGSRDAKIFVRWIESPGPY